MKPIDSKEVARLTQQLDALQQQRSEYMVGLGPITQGIRETEAALALAISEFELNERVIWIDGRVERRAIIGSIMYSYGKPQYYVHVLKKDGQPGIRLFRVWGYQRQDGRNILRPDPGATPASNNIPATTVGGERVVPAVGDAGACARISTPGMKRTENPPVGWR